MRTLLFYRLKERFTHTGAGWDQLAPTTESAIDFAHTNLNEDPPTMIDLHHYSMEYCLAHSAESINERYRNGYPYDIDTKITDTLFTYTTGTDLVLYRGVCDHVYDLMVTNAKDQGCDLYEKGFLCTSLCKGHEYNYKRKLRIYVPKGTHAVYQGNVNYEQENYEVDIQRGAKLNIISADNTYINCLLLETVKNQ